MTKPAVRLVMAYGALGAVWLLASWWLLAPGEARPVARLHVAGDLAFLALSMLLIHGIAARELRRKRRSAGEQAELDRRIAAVARFEAIGQLTGGVAHDFNNLITAISGNIDSYLSQLAPGDVAHELREARRSTDRAAELTRQLLAFGRRQVLRPEPVDVNHVIQDMSSLLHRLIGDRVRILTDLEAGLWTVHVDPGRLEQVVMNLAINARDAMPEGGELRLTTSNERVTPTQARKFPFPFRPGTYVRLDVTDTGIGMDAEVQAHIFEPFYTTKPKDVGTGLGLATVYGIVKQSGGHITVASRPGAGATFSVFLPDARASDPASEPETAAPAEPVNDAGTETILVVEDDRAVRSVIIRTLQRRGFAVLEASDGEEAMDVIRSAPHRIDLLITDAVMPRMTGLQLIERARGSHPEMRPLLISGYTKADFDDEAPYLAKPFTPVQLARRVREVLDA